LYGGKYVYRRKTIRLGRDFNSRKKLAWLKRIPLVSDALKNRGENRLFTQRKPAEKYRNLDV
jgi:hypothetical protein